MGTTLIDMQIFKLICKQTLNLLLIGNLFWGQTAFRLLSLSNMTSRATFLNILIWRQYPPFFNMATSALFLNFTFLNLTKRLLFCKILIFKLSY
jgi:hypothetical protein